MLGFRSNEEVQQVFRKAWAVAVPSIWEEPFGQVTIEAMMNGVAVIASSAGGLGALVRDGQTGFLVQPGDTNNLANALVRVVSDGELAKRLGQAGHELAMADFSEAKMTGRFVQFYESLCSRNKVRS